MKSLLSLILVALFSVTVWADPIVYLTLSWQDTSNDESGFVIERHDGACGSGTFQAHKIIPASPGVGGIVSFQDIEIQEGVTYCYRVATFRGMYHSGVNPWGGYSYVLSGYSNEFSSSFNPATAPSAPSSLLVE